ncbi:hypothetical protein JCGZ_12872 [Jatropha curcas]|uniref:Uncharacterized protein n=1 Tax=Jatropha curcas TaxID=180498 RepID=A0A067KEB3_JATCU|nr:uncharacterized protein LOC105638421 isoform X2 [Jatropha curcas]KDP33323.1 hypothetical protein JCGZ_12872 [Jatropha curcas]
MLLRSASNPLIKSLLSPFSGSLNPDIDAKHHLSSNILPHTDKETISLRHKGFRRAFSDSNLEKLVYPDKLEELHFSNKPKKFPKRNQKTMLSSVPSFSIFNVNDELEDAENNGGEREGLMRTVTIGESIEAKGDEEFTFGKKSMGLIEEEGEEEQEGDLNGIENINLDEVKEPVSPPMYLASGLGIDGHDCGGRGGGGGFDMALPNFDESGDLEEYYKRMIDEYPCHPLFLANYAQLLQSKGDLHGAEEYYHRASLADPGDSEILLKYAKLEWQLHHNQDTALSNFKHAVRVAPQDSQVLAAYASFLWEIDDDKEEDIQQLQHIKVEEEEHLTRLVNSAANQDFELLQLPPSMLAIDVADHATSDIDKGIDVDEYYKRMLEENPYSSLLLSNYAQFLYQSKGDLSGAEEYYSRALLIEPGDGEIMSRYAKLVWELHRDHDKASSYFERAVQAKPEDSHVLAAYASFLWETEENEEDSTNPDQFQEATHHHHNGSATPAAA